MRSIRKSIISNSDALSGIKKCLRYSRHSLLHKGQKCSGLFIIHGRIASVSLWFRISLMCLIRSHTAVDVDCKREALVKTRTRLVAQLLWRFGIPELWSKNENERKQDISGVARREGNMEIWTGKCLWVLCEVNYFFFCYFVCEKNGTHRGKKKV